MQHPLATTWLICLLFISGNVMELLSINTSSHSPFYHSPFYHSPFYNSPFNHSTILRSTIILFYHFTILPFYHSPILPFSVLPFYYSIILLFYHSPILCSTILLFYHSPFYHSPILHSTILHSTIIPINRQTFTSIHACTHMLHSMVYRQTPQTIIWLTCVYQQADNNSLVYRQACTSKLLWSTDMPQQADIFPSACMHPQAFSDLMTCTNSREACTSRHLQSIGMYQQTGIFQSIIHQLSSKTSKM